MAGTCRALCARIFAPRGRRRAPEAVRLIFLFVGDERRLVRQY